jgi:DNA-directed RNA polymerase specialized sigma24 family protein
VVSDDDDREPASLEIADKLDAVRRSVVRHIARRTGRALAVSFDADDITQEACLALLSAGGPALHEQSEDELRRRLHRIARFEVLTAARMHARLERAPVQQHILDALPAVSEPVASEELRGLDRLSHDEHWTLYLRYWLDVPFVTIALLLGRRSVHAVHCVHARAMKRLRAGRESGR